MYTDEKHVTHVTCETVCYDGDARCQRCAKPISYRTDAHLVPTHCVSCAAEISYYEHVSFVRAGDGMRIPG